MCIDCAKERHTASECWAQTVVSANFIEKEEKTGSGDTAQSRLSQRNLRVHTKDTGAQEKVDAKVDRCNTKTTQQMLVTYMAAPVDIGQTALEVVNTIGFKPGDTILLKQQPDEQGRAGGMESRVITRIASIHLDRPTTLSYGIGSEVRLIEPGPGFYDNSLTPPFRVGLGPNTAEPQPVAAAPTIGPTEQQRQAEATQQSVTAGTEGIAEVVTEGAKAAMDKDKRKREKKEKKASKLEKKKQDERVNGRHSCLPY